MNVNISINKMINRIIKNEPLDISDKIRLYAEGVKIKIIEADYALTQIKHFISIQNTTTITTTTKKDFTDEQLLRFYVDSFFTFLYSSFDILAHVINKKYQLNISESGVNLKEIKNHIRNNQNYIILFNLLDKIISSVEYADLNNYRNCSTHRRHICFNDMIVTQGLSTGYQAMTTTGTTDYTKKLICENPLDLIPTFTLQREVVDFTDRIFIKMRKNIMEISNKI